MSVWRNARAQTQSVHARAHTHCTHTGLSQSHNCRRQLHAQLTRAIHGGEERSPGPRVLQEESRHWRTADIVDGGGQHAVLRRRPVVLVLLLLLPRVQVVAASRVVAAPNTGHLNHVLRLRLRLFLWAHHLSTSADVECSRKVCQQCAGTCGQVMRTDPRGARCSFSFCQTAASPPAAYLVCASASAATASSTVSNVPIGRISFFVEPVGTYESRA